MQNNNKTQGKELPICSETAYDDAFRTMEGKCDDILIPFVSHMFGENYGEGAVVKRLRNEHFIEHENGANEKRITDSSFEITYNDVTKRYHLECESSKYDGTILVRIFEYGSQIAKDTAQKSAYKLELSFPNSGLLLLRASEGVPRSAEIIISLPNEKSISYEVPIVKVSDYSIDDIFNEKLYLLLPFYIFNYENKLSEINCDVQAINQLFSLYADIYTRLDHEQEKGSLSAISYSAIIKLIHSVAYKLTMKQENVHKKVGDVMGGKILDLPEFRIYDQGKADGIAEGLAEGEEKRRKLADENARLRQEIEQLRKEQHSKEVI